MWAPFCEVRWRHYISSSGCGPDCLFVPESLETQVYFLSWDTTFLGKQLKQLYYTLIYPYLSYAVISWGSAYTSHLKMIQVKQNHIIHVLFFATLYGKSTESALLLMNLSDILTVENSFTLQLLKFSHQWHKKQLPSRFDEHLHYASDVKFLPYPLCGKRQLL